MSMRTTTVGPTRRNNSPGLSPIARRLVMALVVCILAAPLTTCRLDRLISPSVVDRLAVSLDSLRVSGNSGSIDSRDTILRVTHADDATLPLVWSATKTAAWLTLDTTSGVAPYDLVVSLHADTLAEGLLYQDTIVFTSAQASGRTIRVPVTFEVLAPAPKLEVSPAARDTSAFVGSALPDTFTLHIKNPGALPLNWSAALDTGWITLSDSSGVVPAGDTTSTMVLVTLRPESLSAGIHRGAITFAAPGAIGSPDTVPITYTIQPCAETGITLDAVRTEAITLSDCGAPNRPGRQGKLYAFQATVGDTLSFRLTATAFDAFLFLTHPSGDSAKANDVCGIEVGTACITDYRVPATGRYVIEATTRDSGETGAFTLSAVKELTPSAPAAIFGQFRGDSVTAIGAGLTTPQTVVVFRGRINDPNPRDSVRLHLELVGLSSGLHADSSALVPVTTGGVPVAIRVSGLIDDEAYRWQARTCDKTGRCSAWLGFGNPDPAVDFVVYVPESPEAPGALSQFNGATPIPVGGGTGGGALSTQTVTFRALVTDPDLGDMVRLEVEVKQVGDGFDGSGATPSAAVSSGNTASVSRSFGAPLLGSTDYHWRARACDQTNRCSAWVSFGGNTESATDFHVP